MPVLCMLTPEFIRAILVEMILLVKNLLTVIETDFALQIIVSIIDNAIRITYDIHAIIRILSSIRIFSSAIRIRHPYPRFIPTRSVWYEFVDALGILNIEVHKHFIDLLLVLEKNPDQTFAESLLQLYQDEDKQPLLHVLCDLSKWDPQTDPPANFAVCYFNLPPKFKYFLKGYSNTTK